MQNIKLGSKVRDVITTLEGVAVLRTTYLNGCVRYGIQPVGVKDSKIFEMEYVDVQQLEVVEEPKDSNASSPAETGGPGAIPKPLPSPR